jgi:hypothetical protein
MLTFLCVWNFELATTNIAISSLIKRSDWRRTMDVKVKVDGMYM